jgi:hypothetical protein
LKVGHKPHLGAIPNQIASASSQWPTAPSRAQNDADWGNGAHRREKYSGKFCAVSRGGLTRGRSGGVLPDDTSFVARLYSKMKADEFVANRGLQVVLGASGMSSESTYLSRK